LRLALHINSHQKAQELYTVQRRVLEVGLEKQGVVVK